MVETKRVYILVKTYPTISEKYSELVCTAGILEDGSWIRLYPVPFRQLKEGQQYSKYTWVTVDAERNTKDFRPESFKLVDYSKIQTNPPVKKVNWDTRRSILSKTKIYTNLTELIDEARETNDKKRRAEIYADALDIVMMLGVELPTYQRDDLFAYNINKIDSSTLNSDLSPYSGLLSDIHKVRLNLVK